MAAGITEKQLLSQSTTKNKRQIPCYKWNTVRNAKWFNETLVSAYCAITSPHQVKYLSMTGAKHYPGGHHTTLFLHDLVYFILEKKVVHKHMYFQVMISSVSH